MTRFITIEIGIIGRTYRDVQPKCIERQDAHTMSHHGHTMERGLSVKENGIAIHEVAVDRVSNLEDDIGGVDVLE